MTYSHSDRYTSASPSLMFALSPNGRRTVVPARVARSTVEQMATQKGSTRIDTSCWWVTEQCITFHIHVLLPNISKFNDVQDPLEKFLPLIMAVSNGLFRQRPTAAITPVTRCKLVYLMLKLRQRCNRTQFIKRLWNYVFENVVWFTFETNLKTQIKGTNCGMSKHKFKRV